MALSYRADIDGLRAVAVLPVLLFHAGVPGFSGGFVGVDVFFVISGFLITAHIQADLDRDRFSLGRFYEKRFRRLLPALMALLTATTAAAWWLLPPEDLADYGSEMGAASLFAANLYFWRAVDYFNTGENRLLLHTWSLGVEEQFYLLYPLLLAALARFSARTRRGTLAVGLVLSLALAEWAARTHPVAAFYLLPARAWELLAGALLALGAVPGAPRAWVRELAGAVGLGLVVGSVALLDGSMRFPGAHAVPAVLGSALVVWAGAGTAVGRLLAVGPMVFVGKLSYSLYLWHWPVLLLTRVAVGAGTPVGLGVDLAALALSFALAYAAYRGVEEPLRRRPASRRQVIGVALTASVVAAGCGLAIRSAEGLPGRWSPEAIALADRGVSLPPHCFGVPDDPACQVGDGGAEVVIWGDSHALALVPGFIAVAPERGWGARTYTKTACAPLLGVAFPDDARGCVAFNEQTVEALAGDPTLRTVILSARWPLVAHWTRPEHPGTVRPFVDTYGEATTAEEVFDAGLRRTLEALTTAGKRVVLLGTVPEHPWDVPRALGLHAHLGRPLPAPEAGAVYARQAWSEERLRAAAEASPFVVYLPLAPELCDADRCRVVEDGASLYRDAHHVNTLGATRVVEGLSLSLP